MVITGILCDTQVSMITDLMDMRSTASTTKVNLPLSSDFAFASLTNSIT